MKIAIIDYKLSNMFSVKNALDYLGVDSVITSDKNIVAQSDAAIIPGVGAFGDAMDNLKQFDLIPVIDNHIKKGKPFMGVCLGMQLIFSESEEFGTHKGLNFIPGKVKKFTGIKKIKIPQIGWNRILDVKKNSKWSKSPFNRIQNGEFMYFVHSFYVIPEDKSMVLSNTNYEDITYCSSVFYKNIFATQFHPEKSGKEGLKIYRNWLGSFKLI